MSGEPLAPDVDTFSIMTYNTFMLPGILPRRQRQREPHLEGFLRRSPHDVVVLQECFHRRSARMLRRLRPEFPYQAGPGRGGFLRLTSGVVILSRHPITEHRVVNFRHARGIDRTSRKGAVWARIHFRGRFLQVLGTHLQSMDDAASQAVRDKQYKLLRDSLLLPLRKPEEPQFVVGDLNTEKLHPDGRYHRMLETLQLADAQGPNETDPTWNGTTNALAREQEPGREHRLDYVLLWPGEAVDALKVLFTRVFQPRARWHKTIEDLSDHNALEAQFLIPRTK
jgi:endonuclease/exonuclease/phosphatase family metal-dependent hydrolase